MKQFISVKDVSDMNALVKKALEYKATPFPSFEYKRLSGVKSALATTNFCFKATVLSK